MYQGEFRSYEDVKAYYPDLPSEEDIIYAGYEVDGYEGSAIVVFQKDGKLFENNDGHCSCNELEDWSPEETSYGALMMRNGWPGLHEALPVVH